MDELSKSQAKREQRKRQKQRQHRALGRAIGERNRARADRARLEAVLEDLGYEITGPSGQRRPVYKGE